MIDFIGNLSVDAILVFLIFCFAIFILFIMKKQKKQKTKKMIRKIQQQEELNRNRTVENRKTQGINLVDNKSTTMGGIIASQEKKQNKKIKQNKPIGWVSAKSYGEDAKDLNISKYVPFGDHSENEIKEKNNKEKKQQIIIMAVDDSITILKFISNIFHNSNEYNILLKENAKVALEYLNNNNNNKPNIIISDLNMPEMDGDVFIKKIKENEELKEIPIIVLAKNTSEAMMLIENKIIDGVLPKPFSREDLIKQIEYIV